MTGSQPDAGSANQAGVGQAGADRVDPANSAAVMFEADAASRGLGMELVEVGAGAAVVRMTVGAAMVNGHGIAHGGYVFMLADTAFACASNSYGQVAVAAGADIIFVTSVSEGDVLEATAAERVRYGRSGVYDVTVCRGDEIVAEFRGRSRELGVAATRWSTSEAART
jgi:acyl-CoA thioesterase